jgi:hypothetical protein
MRLRTAAVTLVLRRVTRMLCLQGVQRHGENLSFVGIVRRFDYWLRSVRIEKFECFDPATDRCQWRIDLGSFAAILQVSKPDPMDYLQPWFGTDHQFHSCG